jgi:hypothetical protein
MSSSHDYARLDAHARMSPFIAMLLGVGRRDCLDDGQRGLDAFALGGAKAALMAGAGH